MANLFDVSAFSLTQPHRSTACGLGPSPYCLYVTLLLFVYYLKLELSNTLTFSTKGYMGNKRKQSRKPSCKMRYIRVRIN